MVDINIGGKQYKVPAQHIGGIMNAQSAMEARAAETARKAAEAERQKRIQTPEGFLPSEALDIAQAERARRPKQPTPVSPVAQERLEIVQRGEKRDIAEATANRRAAILTSDFNAAKVLADIENDMPEGNMLYAVDMDYENEIKPIRIPTNKSYNDQPITKAFIMSEWRRYNATKKPVELDDFYESFKKYFK